MAAKDDDYEIQKEKVHERDQIPSKLFGFTVAELMSIVGAAFVGMIVWDNTTFALATVFAVWGYIKYVKSLVPEDFFKNFIAFYRMDHYTYRASSRDYEWRAPIVRKKSSSPFSSNSKTK